MGRPKGKFVKELSLEPISKDLQRKLNINIKLIKKNINEIKNKKFFEQYNEKILIIENIRFYAEEEKNNVEFAKHIANLGDIYVNDAFSCSHRRHASIHQFTKCLPSYSGLQFDLEVNALSRITTEIIKPITCIIGGSKISTKINIIKNLIPKFDNIIIVGGMANNFIEYFGNNVGKSITEKNCSQIIKDISSLSNKEKCKIIFPVDVLVSNDFNGSSKIKEIDKIDPDEMILDIGPKTLDNILNIIEKSKTILWNGPAGYFENPNFANGSIRIAKKIIEKNKEDSIFSVVGGGELSHY